MFLSCGLVSEAVAGLITINIRNTDTAAHSYCVQYWLGSSWQNGPAGRLTSGATFSLDAALSDGNKVRVKWGIDQGAGSSNCTDKPYDSMLEHNGATEYPVEGSGNAATHYFEMVSVSITDTDGIAPEGSVENLYISRTGSTSYALAVSFTTGGEATFSPSQDWSLKAGGNWVSSSATILTGNSSVTLELHAWNDGVTPEPAEDARVLLSTSPVIYQVGTPDSVIITIPLQP